MNKNITIVAHRGFHNGEETLENTFEAFSKAIEIGCDYIECDVLQTSDGVIVCFHNKKYRGTSISDISFEDLQVKLRSQNIELCTFEKYLSLHTEIKLDIEIKERGYEKQVWLLLQEIPIERYVVKSFEIDVLRELRVCSSNMRLGLLISKKKWNKKKGASNKKNGSWFKILNKYLKFGSPKEAPYTFDSLGQYCHELYLSFVSPDITILDDAFLVYFKKIGVEVWPWTIKTQQQLDRMIKSNVQVLVTDIPDIAIQNKTTRSQSDI